VVDLHAGYLVLALRSPLVASASPQTGSLDDLRRLEKAKAAVDIPRDRQRYGQPAWP
jgi:hypothetical protein